MSTSSLTSTVATTLVSAAVNYATQPPTTNGQSNAKEKEEEFDASQMRIDPMTTIIEIGQLHDCPAGTKLSFKDFHIIHKQPSMLPFVQAVGRYMGGESRNDLMRLERPILAALKFYSAQDPIVYFIFKRAIAGLKKLDSAYSHDKPLQKIILAWMTSINEACTKKADAQVQKETYHLAIQKMWNKTRFTTIANALNMPETAATPTPTPAAQPAEAPSEEADNASASGGGKAAKKKGGKSSAAPSPTQSAVDQKSAANSNNKSAAAPAKAASSATAANNNDAAVAVSNGSNDSAAVSAEKEMEFPAANITLLQASLEPIIAEFKKHTLKAMEASTEL